MKIKTRNLTLKEQRILLNIDYRFISLIPNLYKSSIDFLCKRTYYNSKSLCKIENCLKWIDNPSEKIKKLAMKCNLNNFKYIDNLTKEIQIFVVEYDNENIFYINNPCEEVIEMVPYYNLDPLENMSLEDFKQITCLKDILFLGYIPEDIENYIIDNWNIYEQYIKKPTEKMQLFYVKKYSTTVNRWDIKLSKKILDLYVRLYIEEKMGINHSNVDSIIDLICQPNLDISIDDLNKIVLEMNKSYLREIINYFNEDIYKSLGFI